tara:strand:+ start:6772 stop:9246 length:2475 start_codon:yes stop_codon:yes gene_type:complete
MAEKISFFPLDFTYEVTQEGDRVKTVVYIYGKTKEGKQICVLDEKFTPYFYVRPMAGIDYGELRAKIDKLNVQVGDLVAKVVKTEVIRRKFVGKEVDAIKVLVSIPRGVPQIRDVIKGWDLVEGTNEYDIPYVRRYSIDKGIVPMTLCDVEGEFLKDEGKKLKVRKFNADKITCTGTETLQKPRILAVDIETHSKLDEGINFDKNPIIMLACYGENFKKVVVWKKFETDLDYIEFVETEAELLEKFKKIVNEYKPDIIAGYYSDGFDLPYIKRRGEIEKVKLDIGLDYSNMRTRKGNVPSVILNGITHLDIFKFIRKVSYLSLNSYDLNTVAAELLEEKKVDVDLRELHDVWDNSPKDLDKFCEYNLHDAKLVYDLSVKMLPTIIEMVKIVGIPIFDVNRMGYSQLVEWYTMRQAFEVEEIAPNKPGHDELVQRRNLSIKGAFVFEPKPGLYKDIEVFDYRSLYPTIISSHNIGPSTLRCGCCDEDKINVEGKVYWYCKKQKGLIPELIKNIIEKRGEIKKIIKEESNEKFAFLDARQNSLKLLANSYYGYLGFYGARWYCSECAESTTALGRKYVHSVIDKAKGSGFGVVYADTDSCFITLGDKTKEDGKKFAQEVNKDLPGLMELEFEGHYPSGIFVSAKAGAFGAKKKYALMDEKGEMKIKGFEAVRRNWSDVAKEVQQKVLKIILKDHDGEKAAEFVRDVVKELREKKISIEKVTMHTQLQKELDEYTSRGPHVAVAERMRNMGKYVGPGSVIKYVVTQGSDIIRNRSRLPEEVKQKDIDSDYYINHQVLPAVERLFDVLGIDKEQLAGEKEQSKLGKFF